MCCNDYYNYETVSSNSVYTFTPHFIAMCLLLFKKFLWDATHQHLTITFHTSFSCLTLCLQKTEKKKIKEERTGGWRYTSQMRSPSITPDVQNSSRGARGEVKALICTHHSSSTAARKSLLSLALIQAKPHSWHKLTVPERVGGIDTGLKKKKKEWQGHSTDTLLSSWRSGIWSSVSGNWIWK